MVQNSGKNKYSMVMVLVVAVVLILGVIAIIGPMKNAIENSKIRKIQERYMMGEATVSDMADLVGMSAEEYLASYTVEGITGDSKITEFEAALTLKDYCTYAGVTYTDESFATYKEENGLGEDVTADTKDDEIKSGYANYVYEIEQAASEMLNEAAGTTEDAE